MNGERVQHIMIMFNARPEEKVRLDKLDRVVSAAPVERYVRDPAIHCTELESIIESQFMAVLMDRVVPVEWAAGSPGLEERIGNWYKWLRHGRSTLPRDHNGLDHLLLLIA
jgi:hypothetical protein